MAPASYGPDGKVLTSIPLPENLDYSRLRITSVLQNVFCKTAILINHQSGFGIVMRGKAVTGLFLTLSPDTMRLKLRGEYSGR